MRFKPGDVLHLQISKGDKLANDVVALHNYTHGFVIPAEEDDGSEQTPTVGHELIGIVKGIKQLLQERGVTYQGYACKSSSYVASSNKKRAAIIKAFNEDKRNPAKYMALMTMPSKEDIKREAFYKASTCDCAKCVLGKQQDFASQKNGLEEVYEKFNAAHNTQHKCIFLPKFHPELNPIERAWGRMKYHVRRHTDGTLSKLKQLMIEGLGLENLPLCLIRKFCRLQRAYIVAYEQKMDLVTAEKWIKQRRSHRLHLHTMDDALDRIYFPQQTTDLITEMEESVDHQQEDDPEDTLLNTIEIVRGKS